MVKFVSRLLSVLCPTSRMRKSFRRRFESWAYSQPVRRKAESVGAGLYVSGRTIVTRRTSIGVGVGIGGLRVFGGGRVSIGDHVSFGPDVLIQTQNHDYEGETLPYGQKYVFKDVVIGDCVWIGMGVHILPGTTIGEGAIIQGGAVVHGTIPPLAIAGGNPASVFAWRDAEHYRRLKAEGCFLVH